MKNDKRLNRQTRDFADVHQTRLRSSLTQDNLETLMLIVVEKDIALRLKNGKERIIDKSAQTSKELSSLLLLQTIKDYNKS